jgi:hypothetical protein
VIRSVPGVSPEIPVFLDRPSRRDKSPGVFTTSCSGGRSLSSFERERSVAEGDEGSCEAASPETRVRKIVSRNKTGVTTER